MFEQSILLPEHGGKKPWTFAASVLVEVAAVSVLLLVPLIYTEQLGPGAIQSMQISPPVPKVTALPVEPTVVRTAARKFDPFAAPRQIRPLNYVLANLNTPPPECPSCIQGGVPTTGVPQCDRYRWAIV